MSSCPRVYVAGGAGKHPPHPVGTEHDVLPREPQHQPSLGRQQRVAAHVLAEPGPVAVPLVGLGLDDHAQACVDEVGSGPDVGGGDDDLGLDREAGHAERDRAQPRLERVGGLAPRRCSDGAHLVAAGPTDLLDHAPEQRAVPGAQGGVGDGEGLVVREPAQALGEGQQLAGRDAGTVVGGQVAPVHDDALAALRADPALARDQHVRLLGSPEHLPPVVQGGAGQAEDPVGGVGTTRRVSDLRDRVAPVRRPGRAHRSAAPGRPRPGSRRGRAPHGSRALRDGARPRRQLHAGSMPKAAAARRTSSTGS